MDLIQCPHCLHLNSPTAVVCEACGASFDDSDDDVTTTGKLPELEPGAIASELPLSTTTRRVDPGPEENIPRWGGAQINEKTQVVAHVLHHDRTVTVDVQETGTVLLGRVKNVEVGISCLDLSEFEAVEAGVSRKHARFDLKDYSLYIMDLDSTNGTYLNGLRILPNQPRIVRDGDEIRLGRMRLQILFINPGRDLE